ncbi:MAG TPA: thioesterase family protein, partial [Thermoanaerobaculia bacterium]|nr:thioesterase family protein [Thermoanaerobaculia bacterium]
FGGVVLAQALAAARRALPEPRPCRAVVATFPAPVGAGQVELRLRALRHGRAVSSIQVELQQGGEVGCVALVSFGGRRSSAVDVSPLPRPPLPPPEELPPMTPAAGGGPEFTRFIDYRLGFGARPFAGASTREIGGWCRFHAEPGPLGEEHVLALVDAWPSPAVSHFVAPAPAASMTWSIELLAIEPEPAADGWWLYHAELEAARDGYAHAAARLWSPDGRLAALSRQAVAIFG